MMYIGDLLNKIRWDKNSKPEEYMIVYFDRMAGKSYEVAFTAIGREGNFFTITINGRKTSIPLHRIRQVKRNGKAIWERI